MKLTTKILLGLVLGALVGVVVAVYDDLLQMSFGPQPRDYLLFLAVNNVITWTLVGLVIAACVKADGSTPA